MNFLMPPVRVPPMTGVAVAPDPVESVIVTIGALYPVPPLVMVISEIIPLTSTAEASAPDPVPQTSDIVTVGSVYPEPLVSTVMLVIGPFGTGLLA
jgi:hypothetical protein